MPSKITNLFTGIGCSTPIFGLILLGYFFYNRSFMLGIGALVLCFLAGVLVLVIVSQVEDKRKKTQTEFLQTFQPDQFNSNRHKSFTSDDLLSKIALDEQREKIYLWMPDLYKDVKVTKAYMNMPYIIKTYNYSDILAVNLKEDNYETASFQRDTHFANFLVNKVKEEEAAAGSPANQPIDKITSMDLEIIVDDNTNPRHLIRFYYAPYTPLRKDSLGYAAHVKERQEWFTRLKTIIEQQNAATQEVESPIKTLESPIHAGTSRPVAMQKETRLTVEVDMDRYAMSLHDHTEKNAEENPEINVAEPQHEQEIVKPTSYFEQLLEKNRRQLRGDYTDEEK
ncbi:hypothetical protein M3193_07595 [Sporosarcina luteola]|uniref:hypothetical protein n=1 Tax=Sporosarcina luteola TaxID=582850 RepID=UPI00203DA150|nr:hypothetical protein [Sporosarcina luteola]MCM3744006.1 hypothetical protein [Sporosarcina luteola]